MTKIIVRCNVCGKIFKGKTEEEAKKKMIEHTRKAHPDAITVKRDDLTRKTQYKRVNYSFICSLIWVVIFTIGLIGASPYSLETYNTIENYYTTLIILASFLGVFIILTVILMKKRASIKKEIEKLEANRDDLKSSGN